MVALAVAALLSVFLLYTSIAGGTPSLRPSQLAGHDERVSLAGKVVGRVQGDAHGSGLRFRLRDIEGRATVRVVYRGSVPDLFRSGRHVVLAGRMRGGTFVGERGTLMTKCPSKYAPKKD